MSAGSSRAARDRAGTVLLVGGYTVATLALAKAVPMFRRRQRRRFLAAEAGTAAVAAGWALRGKAERAAPNAAMVVVLAGLWWLTGRAAGLSGRRRG